MVVTLDCAISPTIRGQSAEQIRRAFVDLREDHIRYNCSRATYWLYGRRESLRNEIVSELYRVTDPQERDSLLLVLFETKNFTPEERFARIVVQRLREEDNRVPIFLLMLPHEDDKGDFPMDSFQGAHHAAWYYIDAHYKLFEPILRSEIGSTSDMWELWGIAWLMKRKGTLAANAEAFSPAVFRRVAENLKDDTKSYNASQAVRFFLLLSDQVLTQLQPLTHSEDIQQRSLARALIDAITKGDRDAFGFLSSKCELMRTVMGTELPEPDWVREHGAKYSDKQEYP